MSHECLSVRVQVPATTANLGPGFDVAGMALNVYNVFDVEIAPGSPDELEITVEGEGQGKVPLDDRNLVARACRRAWEVGRWTPPGRVRLHLNNRVPTSSGLGSSATAIVGGLVAANRLMGEQLDVRTLLEIATEMEGHPDNVAAALLGGVTLAVAENGRLVDWICLPPPKIRVVAGIPDFQLPTRVARQALPPTVNFEDAVFNVGRVSLLIAALTQNRLDLLAVAMEDRLHHPYRSRLVPGMEAAFVLARQAGALGVALSGAGPTVLAFVPPDDDGRSVAEAIKEAFAGSGVACRLLFLEPAPKGAQAVPVAASSKKARM